MGSTTVTPKDTQRAKVEQAVPHYVTRERFGASQDMADLDAPDESGPIDLTKELEAESGQFG